MKFIKMLFLALALVVANYACTEKNEEPQQEIPDTPDTPDTPDEPDTPDTPDEPDTPSVPVISLSKTTLEFKADGETQYISYEVENPAEGESLVAEESADWLAVSVNSDAVRLTAEKNTATEQRSAEVRFTYGEADAVVVSVRQEAAEPVPAGMTFELNFSDIAHSNFTLQIIPSDANKTFYFATMEKSLYDTFESEEAIYEYEMARMRELAEDSHLTFKELLESQIYKGEKWQAVNNLKPLTEYVSFAFGLTANAERTSGISANSVTTTVEPLVDMDFDISLTEDDLTIYITIKPANKKQPYRWNLYTAADIARLEESYGCEGVEAVYQREVEAEVEALVGSGTSLEEYYSTFTNRGSIYNMEWGCDAETTYYIVATALNESCKPGKVTVYEPTTAAEAPLYSDNEIEVELSNPSATGMQVTGSATNMDPYLVMVLPTELCEAYEDEALAEYILATYSAEVLEDNTYEGSFAGYESGLTPATEYTCVGFGFKNGVRTTDYVARSASLSTLAE